MANRKPTLNEELTNACGVLGQDGNALEIKRAVDKVSIGCQGLLDWEIDVHTTIFPMGFDAVKLKMQGWSHHFLRQINFIPDEISGILSVADRGGTYKISFVFTEPEGITTIVEEVKKALDT